MPLTSNAHTRSREEAGRIDMQDMVIALIRASFASAEPACPCMLTTGEEENFKLEVDIIVLFAHNP